MAVVADTHAIVWFLSKPSQLSQTAHNLLNQTLSENKTVYVSAISMVEIQYLLERARIPPGFLEDMRELLQDSSSGLVLAPLNLNIVEAIGSINRNTVPEMPDRIIAATALHLGLPLIIKDHKIAMETAITTIW